MNHYITQCCDEHKSARLRDLTAQDTLNRLMGTVKPGEKVWLDQREVTPESYRDTPVWVYSLHTSKVVLVLGRIAIANVSIYPLWQPVVEKPTAPSYEELLPVIGSRRADSVSLVLAPRGGIGMVQYIESLPLTPETVKVLGGRDPHALGEDMPPQ